ncbi:MAG TPA: hypothetical protein VFB73_05765 [Chloroflexota bacterium]|nr:hypothetical protein [Chloroflexota bacterium]
MGRQLAWGLLAALALVLGVRAPAAAAQEGEGEPLKIGQRLVTLLAADGDTRTLAVLERIELLNESDTTFVSSATGPLRPGEGGRAGPPQGLLRFALPRDAFDLTVDQRLGAYDVIQVDRGFGSLLPVPPGTTDVTFGYRVPYPSNTYEWSTTVVYPTAALRVLVPAEWSVASAVLRPVETVEIGRRRYQVLLAEQLAAGTRVSVTLEGLPFTPRPWLLEETVQRALALALAVIGVLGAWTYAWWWGRASLRARRVE